MEYVQVNGQAPKELHEIVDAVASIVESLAHGQNVFGAVLNSMGKLNIAVDNAKGAGEELKGDPGACALVGGVLVQRILNALVKKT